MNKSTSQLDSPDKNERKTKLSFIAQKWSVAKLEGSNQQPSD